MNPGIKAGERLFILPIAYRIRLPFFQRSIGGIQKPARGDIVVIISPQYPRLSFLQSIADPLVRFFTLQKASLVRDHRGRKEGKYMLKRVVGVPGDTVKLDDFNAYLKTEGSSTFLGEKDVISVPYSINTGLSVEGWSSDLPFSGNREGVRLGENEYFLLGDNRPYSSDSRSWGAVSIESFVGKVFLRYWPFKKFGKP
jgi:signal peptidase I